MTTSSPVDSPAPSLDGEPRGAAHVDDDPLAERLYERERQKWTWDVRTDDGLALDSRDLRQRRSDWVRDLISIGDSRISESLSERLSAAVLSCSLVDALAAVDQTASWASHGALTAAVAMPSWPHEAVGGFLAILLVFRTDQAYGESERASERADERRSARAKRKRACKCEREGSTEGASA
jgi:hypothetical protein